MLARSTRGGALVAAVLALALGAAACGDDDSDSSTGGAAPTTQPTTADGSTDAARDWIAEFTGGKPGKASGAPVKIGYINQEGGAASFDGASIGYKTLTTFLNDEVSGIQGRPIELSTCLVVSEEDGQKCAAEFLNDRVSVILTGQLVVGSASMYEAIKGEIPVINMNPGTAPDLTAENSYGVTSGAISLGGVGGFVVNRLKPKSVAVIYQDNPTGTLIAQQLLKPVLVAGGITPTLVSFADTATTPDLVAALSSSKAQNADVLVSIISATPCVSFANAYKQLSLTSTVVTEADCYGKQNTEAVGGAWPDGWYFAGNQAYDPHIADEASGVNAYVSIMNADEAATEWVFDTHATQTFAAMLLAVKLFNTAGPDATPEQMTSLLTDYTGPVPLNTGTFDCGKAKTAPNICTFNVNFVQSQGGGWKGAAVGDQAINVLTGK